MSEAPSPDFAAAIARHQEGSVEEAATLYRRVLEQGSPSEKHVAHANLGRIEIAAGRFGEGAASFRAALAIDRSPAPLWRELGAALIKAGDAKGAAEAFRQCLSREPDDATAHYNLALALAAMGQPQASRAALEEALKAHPNFPEARNNLGALDLAAGKPARALQNFDAALKGKADFADAWFNRGIALRALGRPAEAGQAFVRATELRPDFAAAHANQARVLHDLGRLDEAERAYTRALDLTPDLSEARVNRAALFAETGQFAKAVADYQGAHRDRPGDSEILAELVYAKQQACDWHGLDAMRAALLVGVEKGGLAPPFVLAAIGAPGALQTRNAAHWAAMVAPQRNPKPSRRARDGRIRLGYLSGDFHDHATAHLTASLFETHDRNSFVVHGYSYGPDDQSPMRRRLSVAFDDFIEMANWPHAAAAARIRDDGIDILVDLKGYTAGARPQIPALRPAPIQVNWLGFPGSMGVDFMDYVIADKVLAPMTMQKDCVERIVHLPDCFQPNDARRRIGPASARAAHHLPQKAFVFCCFNNSYKLTPGLFAVWMRLLRTLPESVLWLLEANPLVKDNLSRFARADGVDPERLVFAPRMERAAHLARHAHADLFLDTLPVNALTTASDALFIGLPVLTLAGDTVAGRGCASLLTAMGFGNLIMATLADYEKEALALARDPERLSALKARLQQARATAPLFDTQRFVKNLENCYRAMLES